MDFLLTALGISIRLLARWPCYPLNLTAHAGLCEAGLLHCHPLLNDAVKGNTQADLI